MKPLIIEPSWFHINPKDYLPMISVVIPSKLRSAGAPDVVAVADEDEAGRVHHNRLGPTNDVWLAVEPPL